MIPVVIDTNVFVAGLRSAGGASRAVLRRALGGSLQPLFGNALWMEYQDLLERPVWGDATTPQERHQVLAALARQGRWVTVYYGWRANLPDEGDNHLIELALAGGAQAIVTHNLRDLRGGELRLDKLRVLTPAQCLEDGHEHFDYTVARRHGAAPEIVGAKPGPEHEQTGGAAQCPGAVKLGHGKPFPRHGGHWGCAKGTGSVGQAGCY
jgi:predicted nucleic acid-binding protein